MTAVWDSAVGTAVREFFQQVLAFLPNLASAVGLVAVGWLVAVVLRAVVRRVLAGGLGLLGRHRLTGRALERTRVGPGFARLASGVVFWFVITLFVGAAVEGLELPVAAAFISALAAYLPRVLVGLAILFAAVVAGQFVHGTVGSAAAAAGLPQAGLLGRSAQVLLVFFGAVTAADQLGIQSTLLTVVVATTIGALLGGAALAFGMGSGLAVSNIISIFYVLKTYKVGQRVRVGDIQGEIVEISQTGVFIASPEGRVHVPGRRFTDEASVLVTREET